MFRESAIQAESRVHEAHIRRDYCVNLIFGVVPLSSVGIASPSAQSLSVAPWHQVNVAVLKTLHSSLQGGLIVIPISGSLPHMTK